MEMEQGVSKKKKRSRKIIQVGLTYIQCGAAIKDEGVLVYEIQERLWEQEPFYCEGRYRRLESKAESVQALSSPTRLLNCSRKPIVRHRNRFHPGPLHPLVSLHKYIELK